MPLSLTNFTRRYFTVPGCALLAAALVWMAFHTHPSVAAEPAAPVVPPAAQARFAVEEKLDIGYYEDPQDELRKHKLDLFVPKGQRDFPVVVFVHGGAWVFGDKSDFGIYAALGRMLARHGIGAVLPNYRLSPQVQHPEHIKDVARAFAWTHQHIAEHGGRPDYLFVCGHSAGGHLVALLSTDEQYLQAEGLALADIRGAVPISGVFSIPDGWFKVAFGTDPAVHRAASPTEHVQAGCPPFLIVYADRDFPFCNVMSESFARALRSKQVSADSLVVKPRNHVDIIVGAARNDDECAVALRQFVSKHAQ